MLDYEGLMEIAKSKAKDEAEHLYPEGKKRDEVSYCLAHKYYREYVTPPASWYWRKV